MKAVLWYLFTNKENIEHSTTFSILGYKGLSILKLPPNVKHTQAHTHIGKKYFNA